MNLNRTYNLFEIEKLQEDIKRMQDNIKPMSVEIVDKLSDIGLTNNYHDTRKQEIVDEGNYVKGGIINDNPNVLFAEYGTGVKADPPTNNGKYAKPTQSFANTEGASWYIPVDIVDHDLPYSIVEKGDEGDLYYKAYAQKAQHRFREAAENMYEKADKVIQEVADKYLMGG